MGNKLDNLRPMKKGETLNPKGRPKKFAHAFLDALKAEGHSQITKANITDIYTMLVGFNEADLRTIEANKDAPIVFKKVATAILSKDGFDIIERMLDRAHGKATSNTSIDLNGKIETDLTNMSNEQLDTLLATIRGADKKD